MTNSLGVFPSKFFKRPVKSGLGVKAAVESDRQQGVAVMSLLPYLAFESPDPIAVHKVEKVLPAPAIDELRKLMWWYSAF